MEKIYVPLPDVVRNAIINLESEKVFEKFYVTRINDEEFIDVETLINFIGDLDYALGYAHEEIHYLKNKLYNPTEEYNPE